MISAYHDDKEGWGNSKVLGDGREDDADDEEGPVDLVRIGTPPTAECAQQPASIAMESGSGFASSTGQVRLTDGIRASPVNRCPTEFLRQVIVFVNASCIGLVNSPR